VAVVTHIDRAAAEAGLPVSVVKAFDDLASAQRGRPERAMGAAQWALGGGVLSFAIEHTGDLTHRGWDAFHVARLDAGYEYMYDKVEKVLRTLTRPYGFRREHAENMRGNKNDMQKVRNRLKIYAEEHKKLPVFNRMQWLSREAAVALGEGRFEMAAEYLEILLQNLNAGRDHWYEVATKYRLGDNGQPMIVTS
jgi:hypothetical protein